MSNYLLFEEEDEEEGEGAVDYHHRSVNVTLSLPAPPVVSL